MTGRETFKDGMMRTQFPFGKFMPILEDRFKDVTRTPADMHVPQVRVGCMGVLHEVNWSHHTSRSMGIVIVVVDALINHHGPKTWISHVRPMKSDMDHYGMCFCENCLNCSFSNAILAMGTHTTELNVL